MQAECLGPLGLFFLLCALYRAKTFQPIFFKFTPNIHWAMLPNPVYFCSWLVTFMGTRGPTLWNMTGGLVIHHQSVCDRALLVLSSVMIKVFQTQRFVRPSKVPNVKTFQILVTLKTRSDLWHAINGLVITHLQCKYQVYSFNGY